MVYISHRANIDGCDKENENHPTQIIKCIKLGFDVEIDVWRVGNEFVLGHDAPQYLIDIDFLKNNKLWCHAKNHDALSVLSEFRNINCFWHQNDDYTLTSHGFLWAYPGVKLVKNSIAVMPESTAYMGSDLHICHGICTDMPIYYTDLMSNFYVSQ